MAKDVHVWVLGNEALRENLNADIHKAVSAEEIKKPVDAIVMSLPADNDWIMPLQILRRNSEFFYTPVFYQGNIPYKYRSLFDGPADKNMLLRTEHIRAQLKLISPDNLRSAEPETKILNYIYSRSNYVLEGFLTHQSPHLYHYPLVQVLLNVSFEFDTWGFLHDLSLQGLLNGHELAESVYLCPACDSGLLNIQKNCPHCHLQSFKSEKLVHCFACGKIGAVPEFLRKERMVCSNCKVHLLEQGVDFEIPQENKFCLHCNTYFAEEEYKVLCLVCCHSSYPKDLEARHLHSYTLNRRGEYQIRGIEKNIYKNFTLYFNVVDYVEFSRIVNWQFKLSKRYDTVYFSIMHLRFNYEMEYPSAKELTIVEKLMGKLFANLRSVLRESDLSTRFDGNLFFLLPMTNEEGGRHLLSRIKEYISVNPMSESPPGLNIQMSCTTSSHIVDTFEQDSEAILLKMQEKTERQQQFYLIGDS